VKKEPKIEEIHEDVEELSPEWKRELKRQVADAPQIHHQISTSPEKPFG
jgi:hypothetical protein